ncbi:MAG: SDR family oxidoreductase [Sphingobium sp.]
MSEFQGKVAVVTGGAQGMGREYVRLLAEAGAKVMIADVNQAVAEATIAEIGAGDNVAFFQTDVSSTDACDACARATVDRFGGIDFLINNAGLLSAAAHRSLVKVDLDIYHKVLGVMSHGMLYMARAVVPAMEARGGGAIVNISSIGAYQVSGLYSLSKVFVNGLTVNIAHELAASNIRVNAIAPGTVATEGMAPLMTPEQMSAWGKMGGRPTDRVAHPSEIARVGLFLLSDAASYVRGQIIAVDDGQQVRI